MRRQKNREGLQDLSGNGILDVAIAMINLRD
jgi:hypothetical protein